MDCQKISGTSQICISTRKHPAYNEHEWYLNMLFNTVHKTRLMGKTTGSVSELLKKEPRIHNMGMAGHVLSARTWDVKGATAPLLLVLSGHQRTSQQLSDAAQFSMCQSWTAFDFFYSSSLLRTITVVKLDPQEDLTPSIVTLKNHSRKNLRQEKTTSAAESFLELACQVTYSLVPLDGFWNSSLWCLQFFPSLSHSKCQLV